MGHLLRYVAGQQPVTNDQDWNTDSDTTTWAFELIPFYDEKDYDTVENLRQVVATIHIDSRDDFGNTMLMMAVHHNKIGLVKWAITQGADVNAVNFAGVCALHICCHESSVSHELVEELLDNGASTEIPDATDVRSYTMPHLLGTQNWFTCSCSTTQRF